MKQIPLRQILPIENQADYKLHLNTPNPKKIRPLDVFVRNWDEWVGWNSYRGKYNYFNREYIFSLIDFYHEAETWLFGGIFRVIDRGGKNCDDSYKIKLVESTKNLIGRLKVTFRRPGQQRVLRLEKYYNELNVSELLKERYTGEEFCGYENINHGFQEIEHIFRTSNLGWRAALSNVKGVYLITDKSNGKRYVGSAYGDSGIWSRWYSYIETGHGWTDDLTRLIKRKKIEYARENFVISLLEYHPMKADDNKIIARESYWKELLLTRGDFGYNKN